MKLLFRKLVFITCFLIVAPYSIAEDKYQSEFGLEFIKIKAGSFIMGTKDFDSLAKEVSPKKLKKLQKEAPAHKVTISNDYWLATTEVTQGMWYELMNSKPGKAKRWEAENWEQLPVSKISWDAAQELVETLNEYEDGFHYRLPTEAEWEYAARAGTSGLRPFKFENMSDYAWYRQSANGGPQPVGTLKPNAWGLYDMIGNVWEWVNDSYDADYYSSSPSVDPTGPETSTRKVMRGGSYFCTTERVRVAIRGSYINHRSMPVIGVRIAASKVKPN
ncbi:MAG: SUMF1/EgtB/PvdO family nonheme iron enzyme [Gammaproteobacteria bacterium]|nr:SUMF1/EgtB/PvdO family nonheme iron enzyme [Gammaproteobacteria bacterium]